MISLESILSIFKKPIWKRRKLQVFLLLFIMVGSGFYGQMAFNTSDTSDQNSSDNQSNTSTINGNQISVNTKTTFERGSKNHRERSMLGPVSPLAGDFSATIEKEEKVSSEGFKFNYNETYSGSFQDVSNGSSVSVSPIDTMGKYDHIRLNSSIDTNKGGFTVSKTVDTQTGINKTVNLAQGMKIKGLNGSSSQINIDTVYLSNAFTPSNIEFNLEIWTSKIRSSDSKIIPNQNKGKSSITVSSTGADFYTFNYANNVTISSTETYSNSSGGIIFFVLYRTDSESGVPNLDIDQTSSFETYESTDNSSDSSWISQNYDLNLQYNASLDNVEPEDYNGVVESPPTSTGEFFSEDGLYTNSTTVFSTTNYKLYSNDLQFQGIDFNFDINYTIYGVTSNITQVTYTTAPDSNVINWTIYFDNTYTANENSTKYFLVPNNFTISDFIFNGTSQTKDTDYFVEPFNAVNQSVRIDSSIGTGNFTITANSTNLFNTQLLPTFIDPGSGFQTGDRGVMGKLVDSTGTVINEAGDRVKAENTTVISGISNGVVNASLRAPNGTIFGPLFDTYNYTATYDWNGSLIFETVLDPDIPTGVWSFQFRWFNGTASAAIAVEIEIIPVTILEINSPSQTFNALENDLVTLEVGTLDQSHDSNWTNPGQFDWTHESKPMTYDRFDSNTYRFIHTTSINLTLGNPHTFDPGTFILNVSFTESIYTDFVEYTMNIYYRGGTNLVTASQYDFGESIDFDFAPLNLTNENDDIILSSNAEIDLLYRNSTSSQSVLSQTNYSTSYDSNTNFYNITVSWLDRFERSNVGDQFNEFELRWNLSDFRETANTYYVSTVFNLTILDLEVPSITNPTPNNSTNIISEEDTLNNYNITWDVSDDFLANYTIQRTSDTTTTVVPRTLFTSNTTTVKYTLQELFNGTYDFKLNVTDQDGNWNTSTITINVIDQKNPELISSPGDLTISIDNDVQYIRWNYTDNHPDIFEIYKNDTNLNISPNSWNNSGDIEVNIGSLADGYYNYTIQIFDKNGNSHVDTIFLDIDRTMPEITNPQPSNQTITYELGSSDHQISIAVGDVNPANYSVYKNGSIFVNGTAFSTLDQISWINKTIYVNITGLDIGVYNFTFKIQDSYGNYNTTEFTITVEDTTDPTATDSGDATYEEAKYSGKSIDVTPSDTSGGGTYSATFRKEGSSNNIANPSNSWTNGVTISYSIPNDLDIGTYIYDIEINDTSDNSIQLTITITITDNTEPIFHNTHGNTTIEASLEQTTFNWNITDLDADNPDNYTIYVNGAVNATASWSESNINISYTINNTEIGIYNVTVIIYDLLGNFNTTTFFLTVEDTTFPTATLSSTKDLFEASVETTGNLTWTPNDPLPAMYNITRNGTFVTSGIWSNGHSIVVDIPLDQIGDFEYILHLNDTEGNSASFNKIITIEDTTAPTILSSGDKNIDEFSSGNILNFTLIDVLPANNYTVLLNGTVDDTNSWESGDSVIINLDSLPIGLYNYTIIVHDTSNNIASATAMIGVGDTTKPTLTDEAGFTFELGASKGTRIINWTAGDSNPATYTIYNNSQIVTSGDWDNSTSITIDVSGLPVGEFNLTIVVMDQLGNYNIDTVIIQVIDTTAPTISSPEDFRIFNNQSDQEITWEVFDLDPASYKVLINNSGSTQSWNGSDITYELGLLSIGIYNVTIIVTDASGNSEFDTVFVTVKDSTITETEKINSLPITKTVYEGDSDIISDSWDTKSGRGIQNANVTAKLYVVDVNGSSAGKLLSNLTFTTITNSNGEYLLNLTYLFVDAGIYKWVISFTKSNYENRTVTEQVTVKPHSVTIELDYSDTLVQGEEFTIVAKVRYASFNNSGLGLNSIGSRRSGGVKGVNVTFTINYITPNGANTQIIREALTNEDGNAFLTLSPSDTSAISEITGINAGVLNYGYIDADTSNLIGKNSLPSVEGENFEVVDAIDLIETFVETFWSYILIGLLVIVSIIAIISRSVRKRRRKQKVLHVELENAIEEINAIQSIQAIILKNSESGIPFFYETFEEEDNSIDASLISSLTTAISTFLSELQAGTTGFETMERQGISITSHRYDKSDFIVISDTPLPLVIFDQMEEAHSEIELTYQNDLENPAMVQEIPEDQIFEILIKHGFKVDLKGFIEIDTSKVSKVQNNDNINRTVRNNMYLLHQFAEMVEQANLPINLASLLDFLQSEGLNKDIASRVILVSYNQGILYKSNKSYED